MDDQDLKVAEALGRIEGKLDNITGWVKALDKEVQTNTRWRWGLAGILAFMSAIGSVLALLK